MRNGWIGAGGLAVVVVAIYAIALGGEFIFDDIHHIVENPSVRSFGTVLGGGWQETRPVFLLSLAANYAVGEYDPFGYRLVNVLLHAVCAALLYGLLRRSRVEVKWFPEAAALLFAVHPLATEAVTYVNSRSGVLAATFGLAAMLLYVMFHDRRSRGAWIGALVCMALAMGSKESAVVFPVLLFLYLVAFRYDGEVRGALRGAAPMIPLVLCIAIVPLLLAVATNPHSGTIGAGTLPVLDHALTQTKVVAYFVGLCFVPAAQNLDYDFPLSTGVDLAVVGSTVGILALIGVAVWQRRRAWPALVGCVWFFVALAPTNSIVPFKDFVAERHLYLALAGFAIAAGWGFGVLIERRRIFGAALGAYAVALAMLAVARNVVLADPVLLWEETVASSPNKARPHVNLGIYLVREGDLTRGGEHLLRAVELDPDDHRAQFNAGVYLEKTGRGEAALDAFRIASNLQPTPRHLAARARAANNLGIARFRANQLDDAEQLFLEAGDVDPNYARPHYNIAEIALRRGNVKLARMHLLRALEIDPTYAKARAKLGRLRAPQLP